MSTFRYPPLGPGEDPISDATPLQTVVHWSGEAVTWMAKADLLHDSLPSRANDHGERKACASLSRVALANLHDLSVAVERAQEAYQNLVTAAEGGGI